MRIISADQRLAEPRGVKALIVGPTGVGKTWLLRTLNSTATLFIDIEAGDLSVLDLAVDTIRVDDWATARDLACRIGGANPSSRPAPAIHLRIMQLVAARSKISIGMKQCSSTRLLLSRAYRFDRPSNSQRRLRHAAPRICGPLTECTRAKC